MGSIAIAMVCAGAAAWNFSLYAGNGSSWSLGGGIFCSFLVLINLVVAASEL